MRELLPHAADEVDPPRPLRAARALRRLRGVGGPTLQLPFADGRDHDHRRRESAQPPSAPRWRSASASTEAKDAALEATARLLGERSAEILEANAADLADERAAGLTEALRDRLTLSEERIAAMADGRAGGRRARRPGRRGARAQDAGERPRPAQGAGAARGRRRRLRGAPERDDRLRGADDQERQRDRPARLPATPSAPTGRWRRSSARRWPRPACPRTRCCCSPAAATRSWPSWRPRTASSTC